MDNKAVSSGAMLVLIPFIIAVLLSAVFIPLAPTDSVDTGMSFGGIFFVLPQDYDSMNYSQRSAWLNFTHGGGYTVDYDKGRSDFYENNPLNLIFDTVTIIPGALALYDSWTNPNFIYPDDYVLDQNAHDKFCRGDASGVDYAKVTESILTLNPPALEHIDPYGGVVRAIMIVSVAVGLVELLWIG